MALRFSSSSPTRTRPLRAPSTALWVCLLTFVSACAEGTQIDDGASTSSDGPGSSSVGPGSGGSGEGGYGGAGPTSTSTSTSASSGGAGGSGEGGAGGAPAECGNGALETGETCDGAALGGATCQSEGFPGGGTLACATDCMGFDTTGCFGVTQCSNGIDDDGDGFIDLLDPGCTNAADDSELVYAPNCNGQGSEIWDITRANTATFYRISGQSSASSPAAFSGTCGGNGRERIFVYKSPIAQPWIVFSTDELGTTFDTVLYVRRGSCTGTQAACNDDVGFFAFYWFDASEVEINDVAAGEELFIFVDAFSSNGGGTFELGVYPSSAF